MNVSFLTSGHDPFDDRIYFNMAKSLSERGHSVTIITSTFYIADVTDGIILNCFDGKDLPKKKKALEFISRLDKLKAEVIICSEPLPVYAAGKYKKNQQHRVKIIYDVTEWYPSKKNLCVYNQPLKWFHFCRLFLFNIWASSFADAFIFGEWYKSRLYRFLFPGKRFVFLSYFPDLKYINRSQPDLNSNTLRLSYSGKLTRDKGFDNFVKVLDGLSSRYQNTRIDVKIIGWPDPCEKLNSRAEIPIRNNIVVSWFGKQSFLNYLNLINDTDLFLDLRYNDLENRHCLPVKIFYFAAFGRPVIFTDLKSIRKEIDTSSFGFLVNPSHPDEIIELISEYMEKKDLYLNHCNSARKLIEEKYNWRLIEPDFARFIISILD